MKRASLNLSINAIVVLVLAITILGLGLGFIKSQFSTATQSFEVANQELETAIIKDLETSGDKISLKQVEFDTVSGEPSNFYYGIKNNDDKLTTYWIQFLCGQSLDDDCDPGSEPDFYSSDNNWNWFSSFKSVEIPPNTGKAIFAELQPNKQGTFKGKLIVFRCLNESECGKTGSSFDPTYETDGSGDFSGNVTQHAVEKFTMKVK